MSNEWNGIMKVLWIKQWRDGELIWEQDNVRNLLHTDGESFVLRAVFTGGKENSVIPDFYYMGLDNRSEIVAVNTMDSLVAEPIGDGYLRQAISSAGGSGGFVVTLEGGNYRATSPIVGFRAEGGSWGPIQNVFLTNSATSSGILISSAKLDTGITVADGDQITMRIGLVLKDCPDDST